MKAGRKTLEETAARRNEALAVCKAIREEARKIDATGHVVVITSPIDKKPLSVAIAVKEAIERQLQSKTEPPRTSSGRRFTKL